MALQLLLRAHRRSNCSPSKTTTSRSDPLASETNLPSTFECSFPPSSHHQSSKPLIRRKSEQRSSCDRRARQVNSSWTKLRVFVVTTAIQVSLLLAKRYVLSNVYTTLATHFPHERLSFHLLVLGVTHGQPPLPFPLDASMMRDSQNLISEIVQPGSIPP